MNFAEQLRSLRIGKRLTLRDCTEELGVDASNWSKLERGIVPAPKDLETVKGWAEFFGLTGLEKQGFLDLAALSRGQIPEDLATDEALLDKLPAFFRVARGKELEGDRLTGFIEDFRKLHQPASK